jgi:hypothetical protein
VDTFLLRFYDLWDIFYVWNFDRDDDFIGNHELFIEGIVSNRFLLFVFFFFFCISLSVNRWDDDDDDDALSPGRALPCDVITFFILDDSRCYRGASKRTKRQLSFTEMVS